MRLINELARAVATERKSVVFLAAYSFVLLFFCSQMSPLYPANTGSDQNIYFTVGKMIFEGKTLYTEAFDHKGPLIFVIYGIGYLLSPDSFTGVFFIEWLSWIIMMAAAYFTAKLYVEKTYALLATMVFPLFLFKYTMTGGAAEEFILVFQVVSCYAFIRYFKRKKLEVHHPLVMLLHGLMAGCTFFIKLNLIVFWFFPLVFIFLNLLYDRNFKPLLYNVIAFIAGFSAVALPVIVYFLLKGALPDAYNIYIVINSKYASYPGTAIGIAIQILKKIHSAFLKDNLLDALFIAVGLLWFPVKHVPAWTGKVAILLSGIAVLFCTTYTYSYGEYYFISLHVFNLLGCIAIGISLQNGQSKKRIGIMAAVFLLTGIGSKQFFHISGINILKREAGGIVSQYTPIIRHEKNPSLLNLSFGEENALFTTCNISPEITYFMSPNLGNDYFPELWSEQEKYIENKTVMFIVMTNNFSQRYKHFTNFPALHANYAVVDSCVNYGNFMAIPDSTGYLGKTKIMYITSYLYKRKE